MTLLSVFRTFFRDESGAVTVDWVVLTAAIVGLAIVVITTLEDPLKNAATAIGDEITEQANYGDTSGN